MKDFVVPTLLAGFLFSTFVCQCSAEETITFEQHVRPLLKTHCFHCHGEGKELQAGLDLRLRRLAAAGGESGPAIEPGKAAESLLVQRLVDGEMPPDDVEIRLSAAEIDVIRRWINAGAPTARPEPQQIARGFVITEQERNFWSFRPVRRPVPPQTSSMERIRTPIDQFVLARLTAKGLSFSPDADRRTLLRRAYFDLIGLPPTPQQTAAFVQDSSPNAYDKLLDQLLDSPHYGERWGRRWLDVAGYADSEGYTDDDPTRPEAYKYGDYVIRSFNQDKPYDRFVREQLAGDEMISRPLKNPSPEEVEKLTATGFLRMAPDGTGASGVNQNQARNDCIAETVKIVSSSMLGLTVGCAQCHHHRYDPIAHDDYYRFRAIFEPAYNWKNWLSPKARRVSLYTDADRAKAAFVEKEAQKLLATRTKKQNEYIEKTFQKELAKLPAQLRAPIRNARATPAKKRTPQQRKLLREHPTVNVTAGSLYLYDSKAAADLKKMAAQADKIRAQKPDEEFVRALTEPPGKAPPKSFVFTRGDYEQPAHQVSPGEVTVISDGRAGTPENDPNLPTTGRRLAYAKWLTSGKHPLAARVIANRIWEGHFGRGIVATPGDFGFLGQRPSHPQLLDWLADELVQNGWSMKKLHRLIMTSTVYRQSSQRGDNYRGDEIDTQNTLYWRAPIRRLDAESLRDAVLAVSGKLNAEQFGPPVPVMADRVGQFVIGLENLNAGRPGAVIPMRGEEHRRSIYIQVRRSRPLGVLDTFDAPAMTPNCTARNVSTAAPQSLLLMNSDFIMTYARAMADRIGRQSLESESGQVEHAWRLAYSRSPEKEELVMARQFLKSQAALFRSKESAKGKKNGGQSLPSAKTKALVSLCHALLSSSEFLYID